MNTWLTKHFGIGIVVVGLLAIGGRAGAEPKLDPLFSPGAVLQQGIKTPVWGTAKDGEQITVQFQKQTVSAVAKDGRFMVKLEPLTAGGPFQLTVKGDKTLTVDNVLVGEVWLCSGQSNMAWTLARCKGAEEAIAAAGDPQLRLWMGGRWQEASPSNVGSFSGVGYYFGRDLRKALKVPVGLLWASVGGTAAELWTPRKAIESDPELKGILEQEAQAIKDYPAQLAQYLKVEPTLLAAYEKAAEKAKKEGKPAPRKPAPPVDPVKRGSQLGVLYQNLIVRLQPYAMRGVIWYQGESNAGRALMYRKLFPTMIRCWREAWGQGDFPFLFVQIAPHGGMCPEIREAQLLTSLSVPATAMAVITDAGDAGDIHPQRKEPVGARLALAARTVAYGEKIESSGPVYQALKVDGPRAVLSFTHVGGGLVAEGGALKGFTIAGADKKFVPAEAKIAGQTVVVCAKDVAKPVAVRYGWTNVPEVNLYNKEGLPASPFRTDVE